MDNAEEIMQLLEEFTKMKPKDIPRELEDYLGYVAKTGDPVYQWSLVKCLFREKLLNVITDFYESTPTIDLPPCPNVDPFNYERMKTGLLERLESFPSAPFTVQRICELLTNPRKEYNRADKYMRAIEKNILVVSTREPGTGKRQDGENNQTDTVLNGIPDARADVEDGLNSPLFGTPPASNEVTVSTCSDHEEIEISEPSIIAESGKSWLKSKHLPTVSLQDSPLIFKSNSEEICQKEKNESNDLKGSVNNEDTSGVLPENLSEVPTPSEENVNEIILKEGNEKLPVNEGEELNEKNEVLSTPVTSELLSQPSSDSANLEINNSNVNLESEELVSSDIVKQETSSSEEDTKETASISEVNPPFTVEEVDSELDTKNVTIESPESPPPIENLDEAVTPDDLEQAQIDSEDTDPDSSTSSELTQDVKIVPIEDEKNNTSEEQEVEEAESVIVSEDAPEPPVTTEDDKNDSINLYEESNSVEITPEVTLPPETIGEENVYVETKSLNKESEIVEVVSSTSNTDNTNKINTVITEKSDNNEVKESTNESCEQDRKEGSIIHSTPNLVDVEPILAMEEVSVDQSSCVVEEEEAMDIDESSNQQMVLSEGENEGEPMDQCDQPQS